MKWKLEIDHGGKMCTWHAAGLPHRMLLQLIIDRYIDIMF